MVLLKCDPLDKQPVPSSSSYPNLLLLDLKKQNLAYKDSAVLLLSDEESIYVHSFLLGNASKFLHSLIQDSFSHVIILPSSPPSTLSNLVTLLYEGRISNITKQQARQIHILAKNVGIEITDVDSVEIEDISSIDGDGKLCEGQAHKKLRVETVVTDKKVGDRIHLHFPNSRIMRDHSKVLLNEKLSAFEGRVQMEYNEHPVGQYMGPFDQNKELKLNLQLPNTDLDYQSYTEFQHDGDKCFQFSVKSYEAFEDINKIGAYRIVDKIENVKHNSSDESEESDKDGKVYTCQNRQCEIPCPCPQCCINQKQCSKHKICHIALFDETQHAVSIRSSEKFCLDKTFFSNTYILKYPGIPLNCKKCAQDLLFHHSYHFEFHKSCRFCKQTWYKLKATTEKELVFLEKDESEYFKTVCPYCDKRFCQAYYAKKHIEFEHERAPFQCDHCEKVFHSEKAKHYHENIKHSNSDTTFKCEICNKKFTSEVSRKRHSKYVHSEVRKWSCEDCEAKFKERRDLRIHIRNKHSDFNTEREDYQESKDKTLFRCEKCKTIFTFRKNLKAHESTCIADDAQQQYVCEECKSKFKFKRNLVSHIKIKHGINDPQFDCPECGKLFKEKRSMIRHKITHEEK